MYRIRYLVANNLLRKYSSRTGMYYINGPDTLPPPLSPQDEELAINSIDTDPAARAALIEHNLRLVVYIAKKFENCDAGLIAALTAFVNVDIAADSEIQLPAGEAELAAGSRMSEPELFAAEECTSEQFCIAAVERVFFHNIAPINESPH